MKPPSCFILLVTQGSDREVLPAATHNSVPKDRATTAQEVVDERVNIGTLVRDRLRRELRVGLQVHEQMSLTRHLHLAAHQILTARAELIIAARVERILRDTRMRIVPNDVTELSDIRQPKEKQVKRRADVQLKETLNREHRGDARQKRQVIPVGGRKDRIINLQELLSHTKDKTAALLKILVVQLKGLSRGTSRRASRGAGRGASRGVGKRRHWIEINRSKTTDQIQFFTRCILNQPVQITGNN